MGWGLNGRTEDYWTSSLAFMYLDAPIPAYLPAMKELSKESEVPLSRNKKQQNLFIGDLIEDG